MRGPWVLQTALIVIVLVTSFSLALSNSEVYAQMSISVGISGGYYGCPWWYWYSGYCPYYGYYWYPNWYPSAYGYSYYAQPTQFQLIVNTDPSTLNNTVTGGGAYNMGSSATFSVNQTIIRVSQNARYVFLHWSGDYSGQNSTGTLTMDSAKTVTAVYQLQYYLAVIPPGNVSPIQGSGWYNGGDSVTLTAPTPIGGAYSRFVFNGWNIDGVNGSTNSVLALQMNAPHVVSARYKQQYYLTVTSDQGGATSGTGWYDAGTLVQISASAPPNPAYGITMVFNGWNGTVTSPTDQQTSVLMDAPKTEAATWRADATVLYATVILCIALIFLATYLLVTRRRKEASSPSLIATR